jgi:hypothetical protein
MVLNYIYKYIKYKRMIKIFEIYQRLLESKATEAQGLNMLKKAGAENAEDIMSEFKAADVSKNQKNLPIMAYLYASGYKNVRNITSVVNEYNELEKLGKVKSIQLTRDGLVLGDNTYNDFIKFSEFIHGKTNELNRSSEIKSSVAADFKAEKKPIWSGNGIDIYDGDSIGKCISYGSGGLTGRAYSFCIGLPGPSNMFQSYRDSKTSTFYYIVDKNHFATEADGSVNLDDPLHMVVFDNTQYGVELTDANNSTGTIAEPYGNDANKYVDYLASMGVPVKKMLVNRPKTDQERKEDEMLGSENRDLEWFIKLPMDYKSKYIGRGHLLTNDQFDYLMQR